MYPPPSQALKRRKPEISRWRTSKFFRSRYAPTFWCFSSPARLGALIPRAEASARFLLHAQEHSPFQYVMVQTDNGSEFSTRFTHRLHASGTQHRHSRVRHSNDNAHVERFNRSIQEECLDHTAHNVRDFRAAIRKYLPYYNTERLHMGINYQTPQEVMQRCVLANKNCYQPPTG